MKKDLETSFSIEEAVADDVVGFELTRELGRPAVLTIDVRFAGDVAPENALGKPALFWFEHAGQSRHEMAGIVSEVSIIGSTLDVGLLTLVGRSTHAVRFRVVSMLSLLEGEVDARIFQDLDVREIVAKCLKLGGIGDDQQRWKLSASYEKRPYCVQYFETTLAFVSRLLEEEGITFTTIVEDGMEIVVLVDDTTVAEPIEGNATVPYRDHLGLDATEDSVVSIRELATVCSGKVVLRDYDFERPSLDLTASAEAKTDGDLERYDYPGRYTEPTRGKRLARVRLEADQANREVIELVASSPRMSPGRRFTLGDPPYDDLECELLVVSVTHVLGAAAERVIAAAGFTTEGGEANYVGRVRALPVAIPYRTPQTTPRPRIEGPQTARVVGTTGAQSETLHTDAHGRIKVKFHWDRGPDQDDKASFWIRTSQLQTSGSMVIARLDWEVVIEFLEGDPDRPVVMGKVYNGLYMPPYALPEGKTRTSLQTASSPGGGGTNEIRLEDRAGGEEIMIHAQYDQTKATANNKDTTVGNCSTRTIGVDETIEVSGNQSAKITMGSQLTVGGDRAVSVGGNRNVEVNAVTGITAGGDETIDVGGNHFEMDGNPLAALLQIAAETAIAVAEAAAGAAMEKINAAVQDRVDQVMAPINELTAQVEQIGAGMEALQNGDLSAVAEIAAQAAGLPMPPGFGGGGEAGGGGGDAGGGGGDEAEGGDAPEPSYTERLGIDSAVNSAIETGIHAGADALGEALGLGGGGGGGESAANADGPVGDVAGISGEDRAKGPGHSTRKVTGDYAESVGSLRVQAAIMGIHTEIAGNLTEDVSLAKVQAAWGNIASTIGGDKTTKALGQIIFSKADLAETATGAATTMVGGIVYDKIGGGASIEAGSAATFIGASHKLTAETSITLKCGASEVVIDGSGITITSPIVTITASKIVMTKDVHEV